MSARKSATRLRAVADWLDTNPDVRPPDIEQGWHDELHWHGRDTEDVVAVLKATGIDIWKWQRLGSSRQGYSWTLDAKDVLGFERAVIFVPADTKKEQAIRRFILAVREGQRAAAVAPLVAFAERRVPADV